MYSLIFKPPTLLTYTKFDKKKTGLIFLVSAFIYEIFSLLLMLFIFINLPQSEYEFFFTFVFIQQLPFYTLISSFGIFLLLYAFKLLFYIEGWKIVKHQDDTSEIIFFIYLWFFKSELHISISKIKHFIIHEIFLDSHKLEKRRRLEIEFENIISNTFEKKILFRDEKGDLDYEIPRIIKFIQQILGNDILIIKTNSV